MYTLRTYRKMRQKFTQKCVLLILTAHRKICNRKQLPLRTSVTPAEHQSMAYKSDSTGRHCCASNKTEVCKIATKTWLKCTELHKETESFIRDDRNQAINALNYEKDVLHDPLVTTDTCITRKYVNKTIGLIASGCQILAPTECRTRHDTA